MKRNRLPKVMVIGELNVDLVAAGLQTEPIMGSEILAEDLELTLGSASAIFACGVAQLGVPVTFISKVGQDDFGRFCLDALKTRGISTRYVKRDAKTKTGVTLSLSTARDRALVTYLGAIAKLRYRDIDPSLFAGHRHLHLTSYFLQSGLKDRFPTLLKKARQMGLSTSFDPNSDPSQSWEPAINKVFAETDILFLNEQEAHQLTGCAETWQALQHLAGQVPCAVIKMGPAGAAAVQNRKVTFMPGFQVSPVDTTGAGDSFAAGFITGFLEGRDIVDCLRMGNACGALSTRKPGGTTAQPNQADLKGLFRRQVRNEAPLPGQSERPVGGL
ncbi:MAG: carbohydrate kinase family protein [Acidobacteriota bacterium]